MTGLGRATGTRFYRAIPARGREEEVIMALAGFVPITPVLLALIGLLFTGVFAVPMVAIATRQWFPHRYEVADHPALLGRILRPAGSVG